MRHKRLVLLTAISILLADILLLCMLPAQYEAETLLQVDRRKAGTVDDGVRSLPNDLDAGALSSEINVIGTPAIALSVIKSEHLLDTPEFRRALLADDQGRKGFFEQIKSFIRAWLPRPFASFLAEEPRQDPATAARIREEDAISYFSSKLQVTFDQHGESIKVRYRSSDPVVAAAVANALSKAYVEQQLRSKLDLLQTAGAWLDERVMDLRKKWEDSERAVATYREQHHLGTDQAPLLLRQQLTELNAKLVDAKAAETEAGAKLARAENAAASKTLDAVPEVISSPVIQKLRAEEADLAERVSMGEGPYNQINQIQVGRSKSELAEIRRQIATEEGRIFQSIRADAAVARSRRAVLESYLAHLTEVAESRDQASVEAAILERTAAANRSIVEAVVSKLDATRTLDGLQRPDVRIVSEARVPGRPSSPKPALVLGIGIVGAFAVACGLAVLIDAVDQPIRSGAEGEALLGTPCIGWVPQLRLRGRKQLHDYVGGRKGELLNESLYRIAMAIRTQLRSDKAVVLVTSSVPGEGKTAFALAFARLFVAAGRSCVVIDGDTRRPEALSRLGGSPSRSLADLPIKNFSLDEVVQRDGETNIAFVGLGRGAADPLAIRDHDFGSVISEARDRYDIVIIDAPPLMPAQDSAWFAQHADVAIVLVRWESTPARIAITAIERLRTAGAPVIGFVLSGLRPSRLSRRSMERYGMDYARRPRIEPGRLRAGGAVRKG